MKIHIKYSIQTWLAAHPRARQWLWLITLWLVGLLLVSVLTYPLKLLINIVK
ncbi:MAG TPA: hypothetical protein PK583_02405 [Gammaproteobacteria bacterium]|nr:hypothetical protein [Gammaproteobacteria bacterium]HQY23141.1 hypothetical protein [Gammaproteobacteria bacterium]